MEYETLEKIYGEAMIARKAVEELGKAFGELPADVLELMAGGLKSDDDLAALFRAFWKARNVTGEGTAYKVERTGE